MPKIYPKIVRKKLHSLNLEKVKESLIKNGYKFIRDGGFGKDDQPFDFCNYLFYMHPKTKTAIRVGYDYPFFGNRNIILRFAMLKMVINGGQILHLIFRKLAGKKLAIGMN